MNKKEKKFLSDLGDALSVMGSLYPSNPCDISAISGNLLKTTKASKILGRAIMEILWANDPASGCSMEDAKKKVVEAINVLG